MSKKCISILLAIVLSLSMISLVFAEETTPSAPDATVVDVPTGSEDPTEPASPSDPTDPAELPSEEPSSEPSTDPISEPSTEPSSEPSSEPSTEPSSEPSSEPSTEPSSEPSSEPSTEPSSEPESEPATVPHDHQYSNVIKQATKTVDGLLTQVCSVCGDESSTPIAHIASITLSNKNCIYTGNVKHPKVTVLDADGKTLKRNTDYEVVYNGACQDVGKYSASITFIGKYKGSATRYFNIIPKASAIKTVKAYQNKLVVTVKQRTQLTGYQLKVATKKTFSDAINKYIKNPDAVQKTIKSLDSGATYYVKVRTYATITFKGKTQKLYSAWSDAVECMTK